MIVLRTKTLVYQAGVRVSERFFHLSKDSADQANMPNTGQLLGQCCKCDKCRKDFKTVWLPTNICCRTASWREGQRVITRAPYSRHISSELKEAATNARFRGNANSSQSGQDTKNKAVPVQRLVEPWMRQVNSLAPFSTLGKYTCGYYFSRETDNKKRTTGIPPSDLVAWRSNIS